jgi:4-amino-4-deoxy-L-arabinose transferase-like glycosyltransferase
MTDSITCTFQQRLFPLVILMVVVISLVRLTDFEIQASDEGYYALRVKAILQFDCWLDQTDYAIGGFYSSSHPPLLIWLMALTSKIFGLNNFSLRLWSWISFVVCTIMVGKLAELTADEKNKWLASAIAASVIGLSPLMIWYGRLAQFDMMVTLWSTCQALCYVLFLKTNRRRYLVMCGLALGLALLSKALVGVFAAAAIGFHLLYLAVRKESSWKDFFLNNLIFLGIGLTLGFSWFIGLCATREGFFEQYVNSFIVDRMLRDQFKSPNRTGIFFFVNVILTRFPLVPFLLIWLWKFYTDKIFRTPERVFWLLWFLVPFIIFSISKTKLIWYVLICVPPLAVMIAESIVLFFQENSVVSARLKKITLAVFVIISVWSLTQVWHRSIVEAAINAVAQKSFSEFGAIQASRALGMIILMLAGIAAVQWVQERKNFHQWLLSLMGIAAIAASLNVVLFGLPAHNPPFDGMSQAKAYYDRTKPPVLIFMLSDEHPNNPGMNPQFSYYFSGIDVSTVRWQSPSEFICLSKLASHQSLGVHLAKTHGAMILGQKVFPPSSEFNPIPLNIYEKQARELGLVLMLDTKNYVVYQQP